jgi:hypothetical protein
MISQLVEDFKVTFGKGKIHTIVSGTAQGIDVCGEAYAREVKLAIERFHPDWEKNGKAAGPIRNREMAKHAHGLLLIWDGESKGSANMLSEMKKQKKPIMEVVLRYHR